MRDRRGQRREEEWAREGEGNKEVGKRVRD